MKKYAFLSLLLGFSGIVQAEPQYSNEYNQCLEKAAGVTTSIIACTDAEIKQQDKKLNDNYKVLKDGMNAKRQKQLKEIQRLWLQYRDANCKFYAAPDSGSMQQVMAVDCVLKMTAERAEELSTLSKLSN